MNRYYMIIDNVFTPEECYDIINSIELDSSSTFFNGKIGVSDGIENNNIRRTYTKFIKKAFSRRDDIKNVFYRMDGLISDLNINFFGVDISGGCSEVQACKYTSENQGFYNWHSDSDIFIFENAYNPPTKYVRKLSAVLFLSNKEDYEGGNLELEVLLEEDKQYMNVQGSVIVFPSFLNHRVSPVTRGVRYSGVFWYMGKQWS